MAEIKKINTELQPIDKLLDTSGDAGTSGQILSTTGSGTNWIDNTGAGGGTVTGSGTATRVAFWSDTTVLSSNADLYWDNTNSRLGIGITTPVQKLHIVSTDGANIILNSNTGAENSGIWMTEAAAVSPYTNGAYVYYDGTNNAFKINTGTTTLSTKFTIDRDTGDAFFTGRVAIGNTSVDYNADADDLIVGGGSGDTGITIVSGSSAGDYGAIYFADGQANGAEEYRGIISYEQNNEIMRFHTNTVEALELGLNQDATFAGQVKTEDRFVLPTTAGPTNRWIYTDNTDAGTGSLTIQSGAGSAGYGGGLILYSHSHASTPGWVKAGISVNSGGKFSVNTHGTGGGTDVFTVDTSGNGIFAGTVTSNAATAFNISTTSGKLSFANDPTNYYIHHQDSTDGIVVSGYYGASLAHRGNVKLSVGSGGIEVTGTQSVSGTATFAGSIGLGGATIANNYMIEMTTAGGNILRSTRGSSVFAAYQSNNSHVYLGTTSDNEFKLIQNDGVALTIDTSKDATFEGKILAGTGTTAAATINAFTTTVSANLYSALRIIENSAASTYWDIGATGGASPDLKFFVNAGTTPKFTLSTAGAATFEGDITNTGESRKIRIVNAGGAEAVQLLSDGSGDGQLRINNSAGTTQVLLYGEANADQYIDNGGDLGIGTKTPGYKLQVAGSVALDVMPTHESEGIIRIGRYDANTTRYNDIKSYVSSTAASNYLKFSLHNGTASTVVDVLTLKGDQSATFAGQVTIPGTPTANTHAASKGYVDTKIIGSTIYQGTWNANTNTPDLTTSTYKVNGYYFVVSVEGTQFGTLWHVGDWIIYNDHTGSGDWQKIDNTSVISGAGTAGTVVYWTDTETLGDSIITQTGTAPSQQIKITSNNDAQLRLDGGGTSYAGIGWFDTNGSDYIWFNGANGTFAIGGGGANVSGKKLHIDGGTSIGVNYDAASPPTNGLVVEGNIRIGTSTLTANTNFDNLVIEGSSHTGITIISGSTGTDSDGGIYFGDNASNHRGQLKYLHGSNSMTFSTNDILALTLDTSQNATFAGNVTINKASNPTYLRIGNNLADDAYVYFNTDGIDFSIGIDRSDSNNFKICKTSSLTSADVFIIDSSHGQATFKNTLTAENAFGVDAGTGNNVGGISWGSTDSGFIFAKSGNATKVYLDSAGDSYFTGGDVGIGTSTPGAKLSVQNTSAAVTSLLLGNNSGSTGDYQQIVFQYSQTDDSYSSAIRSRVQEGGVHGGNLSFWTHQNGTTTLTERMTIDRVGKVGIGTTTPDAKLSVTSAGIASEDILYLKSGADNADEYLGIAFETGGGGNGPHGAIRVYNGPSGSDAYMSLLTTTDGGTLTQGLTQDHLGNIGIGTTTPQFKLHIEGTGAASEMQILASSASDTVGHTAGIGLRAEGGEADSALRIKGAIFFEREAGSFGTGKMHLAVNGAQSNDSVTLAEAALTINDDRDVGIGTTSPGAKLEVNSGGSTGASGDTDLLVQHSSAASTTAQIQILAGNTGYSNIYLSDTDSYSIGGFIYNHTNNSLTTRVTNQERMHISGARNTAYVADGIWGGAATPCWMTDSGGGAKFLLGYQDNGSGLYAAAYGFETKSTDGLGNTAEEPAIILKNTNSNSYVFQVSNLGSVDFDSTLTLTNGELKYGGSGTPYLTVRSKDSTTTACGIKLYNGNNSELHGYLYGEGDSTNTYFGLLDGSGSWLLQSREGVWTQLWVGGSCRMHIDTGSVGIGTTSPQKKLDVLVAGGDGIRVSNSTNSAYYSDLLINYNDVSTMQLICMGTSILQAGNTGDTILASRTNKDIVIDPGGTGNVKINADTSINRGNETGGELLLGGTTDGGFVDFDSTNLQLNTQRDPNTGTFVNTSKSHAHIGLQGPDGGSQIVFGTAAANNTVATTRLTINSAGNATFAGAVTVTGDFTRTGRFSIGGDVNVDGTTDLMINGASRRISFTSGSGTIKTTTGNSLILQTNSSDGIVIDGSTQTVTFAKWLYADGGNKGAPAYSFTGDTNTGMYLEGADTLGLTAGGNLGLSIGTSSISLKVDTTLTSSNLVLDGDSQIELDTSLASGASGTIIKIGTGTLTAGVCYMMQSDKSWAPCEVGDEEFSRGLIAIALGTSPTTHGMLTNGIFYDSSHSFTAGLPLFLTGDAGALSNTAPTTSGDLVRVVGYAVDTDEIYFCPDNTWVILD